MVRKVKAFGKLGIGLGEDSNDRNTVGLSMEYTFIWPSTACNIFIWPSSACITFRWSSSSCTMLIWPSSACTMFIWPI